jgi:hypothetical protein
MFTLQRTQKLEYTGSSKHGSLYLTSCTSTSHYLCSNGVGDIFVLKKDGDLQFKLKFGDNAIWSLIIVKDDSQDGREMIVAGNTEGKMGVLSLSDG